MINKNSGQSLIEVVFSVGLVILVTTGIAVLLVNIIGSRTKSHERVRTAELSEIVMESLVSKKNNDPDEFWDMGSAFWVQNQNVSQTNPDFPGYEYVIEPSPSGASGCGLNNCLDIVVSVGWSGSPDGSRNEFNRFFGRI